MSRPSWSRSKIALLFGAFAVGALLMVASLTALLPTRQESATSSTIGGPFRLTDQNGLTVTEADLKGKASLVFFGFTHCPDVCPTALFDMSELIKAMGPDADKVQVFFVTVDPERDTPEVMKAYISSFDPRIRGLSGPPDMIEAMERAYRVYAKKVPLKDGDYTMDHTALVYLMDKSGAFVAPFNTKRAPQDAANDLRRFL